MNLSVFVSKHTLFALFALLLIVLYVDPRIIKSLNQNVLGRIVLLIVVVFFAANDTTAGLLVVLMVISIMQMYYIKEGFSSGSSSSTSSKPTSSTTNDTTTNDTTTNDTTTNDTVNVTTDDTGTTSDTSTTSSTGATSDQIDELKQKIQAQIQAKMDGSSATGSKDTSTTGTTTTDTTSTSTKKPSSSTTTSGSTAAVESFFGMGDLLSVDLTRKTKSSKEQNKTYQAVSNPDAEAAPSSERIFGSSLTFAPF